MTKEEIFAKLRSGAVSGKSALSMRSEDIQQKHSAARLPKLKKELRKKSKLLVVAELAVPFNPVTGVEDDEYNASQKFRPAMSATSVALYLKSIAAENEVSKEAFMKRAGVTSWDLSNLEVLTDEDKKIFGKYRVARIFTVPVCKVNIPKMTNNNFGRSYAVNVEYDNLGNVVGDTPMILKVNKLFRDVCYEKIAALQKQVDSGEVTLTEDQQKEKRQKFRSEIAVSDVAPSNWVEIVEVPLTAKYDISAEFNVATATADSVREHVVVCPVNKKLGDALASYVRGDYEFADKYFDFFEIDMTCPADQNGNSQPVQIYVGSNTTMETPKISLEQNKDHEILETAIREYVDNDTEVESIVRRSTYIMDYNDDVADQILSTIHTVLDVTDNPYVTKKVIEANREVLELAYGDDILNIIEEVEAGVSEKAEGLLDETESKKESKYNMNDMFADDGESVASIDVMNMVV